MGEQESHEIQQGEMQLLPLGSIITGWGLASWKAALEKWPWEVLEDKK